jgi:quinol monooxygenase YgiN
MKYLVPVLLLAALPVFGDDGPVKGPPGPPSLVERFEQTLKSEDMPITIVTQIYVKSGVESEFEAAAVRVAKASEAEEGCVAYEFHRDLEKPTRYTLIERWTGLAPLRKHLEMAHTKQIQAVFAEMSTTPRTTEIFTRVDGQE